MIDRTFATTLSWQVRALLWNHLLTASAGKRIALTAEFVFTITVIRAGMSPARGLAIRFFHSGFGSQISELIIINAAGQRSSVDLEVMPMSQGSSQTH